MWKHPRLLLAILAVVAFGNAIRGSFHFDDYSLLIGNTPLFGLFRFETTRPLTYLFLGILRALFGENPLPFHIAGLLIHVLCVILLFDCAVRLSSRQIGLIAAGLFAIHPIQTEAVSYVFAASTLLMTAFCLASWHLWLMGRHWAAVLVFAFALLAKEECVFFPIFLLLFNRSQVKQIAVMSALSLLAGLRALIATSVVKGSGAGFAAGTGVWTYAVSEGAVIWRYLSQLVLPVGFTIDPELHIPLWVGLLGWISLLAVIYLLRERREMVFFTAGLVLLFSSSSVFPAADLAADRRMYLPLISFFIGLGGILARMPRWVPALCAAILIPIAITRTEVWRTERSLWTDAVAKAPTKVRPRLQLARALPAEQGLRLLESTERVAPENPDIPAERGRIYLQTSRPEMAISAFGRAAALSPDKAQAWSNLGVAFALLHQPHAARQHFEHALRLDPCLNDARRNLGFSPCSR